MDLKVRSATLSQFFSQADRYDYALMTIGSISALLTGLSLPCFNILIGNIIDSINGEEGEFGSSVDDAAFLLTILGILNLFTGYLELYCWSLTGHRQTQRIREIYLKSLLSQEIGWFDSCGSNELSTKMNETINKIEDGLNRKIGEIIRYLSQFIGSFIVAYYYSWRISLVLTAVVPLVTFSTFYVIGAISDAHNKALDQYTKAGGVVTESLSSIRTVTSLNLQFTFIKKYRKYIYEALLIGFRKGFIVGVGQGILIGSNFLSYSIGYWYAGTIMADVLRGKCGGRCITGGEIVATFHSIVNGSIAVGQLTPSCLAFVAAKAAFYNIIEIIKRKPLIDESSTSGLILDSNLSGHIKFDNVGFYYPSRPEKQIFESLDLEILPGETVAIIGASGCGKSTIVNILLRFYDTTSGNVRLDSHNIKDLNLQWLRSQIGYVGQEPVLFSGTIAENIAYGLDPHIKIDDINTIKDKKLLQKIEDAAILANALEFINEFPDGFNTKLNSHGLSISGGQKQRIAIARALIKNPPILLLDEATSALDSASEKVVQQSIDKLSSSKSQTTIIIAHRLSTIKNADKICLIEDGKITHIGTHQDLLTKSKKYSELIKLQIDENIIYEEIQNESKTPEDITYNDLPKIVENRDIKESIDDKVNLTNNEKVKLRKIIMKYLLEHKYYCFVALFGGAFFGAVFPLWGYLLAQTQNLFFLNDPNLLEERAEIYAGAFGALTFVALISSFCQYYGIIVLGELLAARIRSELFEAYLRQEISYFDYEENSIHVLSTRLSDDARIINKAFGESLVKIIQACFCLIIAIFLGFFASWEISLILLGCLPINIACSTFQMKAFHAATESEDIKVNYEDKIEPVNGKYTKKQLKILKDRRIIPRGGSIGLISLAFTNMRTISAFSLQQKIKNEYSEVTRYLSKKKIKKASLAGIGFGLSSGDFFFNYAFIFWTGYQMILENRFTFRDLITATMCLMFGAHGLANALTDMGDQTSAFKSALRIFTTLEKSKNLPNDNLSNKSNLTKEQESNIGSRLKGEIEFKNVFFRYPSRKEVEVCKNFNLTILPGQTIALVGPSGSGKSTIVSLLLRFYNIDSGEILIDGININDYNIRWLRSQIGYVGQEPSLFEGNILQNIQYGRLPLDDTLTPLSVAFEQARLEKKDLGEDVSYNFISSYFNKTTKYFPKKNESIDIPEDVLEAAIKANAHSFISEFTDGYFTEIGKNLISGGQKQRIAIARALIKNPPILLLDEATSALDSASEKVVQQSIDKLSSSKSQTTIIIAHRLSTIKNADKIIVIDKGAIVQIGSHEDLLAESDGLYSSLWKKQNSST